MDCPFSRRCPTGCLDAIARGEPRLCVRAPMPPEQFVRCDTCHFARPSERVDWGTAWVRCSKSGQEMPLQHAGCMSGKREVA